MKVLTLFVAMLFGFNAVTTANNAPVQEEKMVAVVLMMDNGDDRKVVTTIFTSAMAAEKVAKALNIEVVSSEDPVADDVYVFALKSEEQKNIAMQMFDEEGYSLSAHRQLNVNAGENLRAVNVQSMEDGHYILKLSDENGNEKIHRVKIKRD
jgi:hypothetical protein